MVTSKAPARLATFVFGFAAVTSAAFAAQTAPESAQIVLGPAVIDEVARSVLPVDVDLPQPLSDAVSSADHSARLAELKYCGVSDKRSGRFRIVVLQKSIGKVQSVLAIEGSCQASLTDLAKPAAMLVEQGQSLLIAEVEVSAKASDLRLSVARAVAVHGGRKGTTDAIDKRIDLPAVSLSAQRFDVGAAALFVQVAPAFAERAVSLSVAVAEKAAALRPSELRAGGAGVDGKATLAAEIPLPIANLVLRRLSASQPITIALENDSVDLRNITVQANGRGANAKVIVNGTATPKSIQETLDWTLNLAGDPLQVSSVEAAARVEDCSALASLAAVTCNLRNGGRVTGAQAFASALTSRYGGRPVHELVSPLDTRFSVAGWHLHVSGDVLRIAGGANGIAAAGNVSAVVEQ